MKIKKNISRILNGIFILITLLFILDVTTSFEIKSQTVKSFTYFGIMIFTPLILVWNLWHYKTIKRKTIGLILPVTILIGILIIGPTKIAFSSSAWRTKQVIYEHGHLNFKKVESQTQDLGALGYNNRTVDVIYLTDFFMVTNPVQKDIDKKIEWIKNEKKYYDVLNSDTINNSMLFAVGEEFLQYGSEVAYIDIRADTIIPFGQFGYLGTDTLKYYANISQKADKDRKTKWSGINRKGQILFDLVNFDNGPDYFSDGLTRIIRSDKMGFANKFGQVVIPCQFDYALPFKNGKAKVTFKADEYIDQFDEHKKVKSEEWFYINKFGQKVK
jgi:hypothetical protein